MRVGGGGEGREGAYELVRVFDFHEDGAEEVVGEVTDVCEHWSRERLVVQRLREVLGESYG